MSKTVVVLDYEEFLTLRDLVCRGVFYAEHISRSARDAKVRGDMTGIAKAGQALLNKLLGAERIDIVRPETETRVDLLLDARDVELVGASSPET